MQKVRTTLILFTLVVSLSVSAFADYVVAPGDVLDVQVVAHETLNTKQEIAPDGTASFPLLGRLKVQGKTLAQLDSLIQTKYRSYIERPQVVVSVKPAPEKQVKKEDDIPIYIVVHDKSTNKSEIQKVKTTQEAKAWMLTGTPIPPIITDPKPGDIIQIEAGTPKLLPVYVVIHDKSKDTIELKICATVEEAKALTGQENIKPGDTVRMETGKEDDWWQENWYKVLTGAAIVIGLFNSIH